MDHTPPPSPPPQLPPAPNSPPRYYNNSNDPNNANIPPGIQTMKDLRDAIHRGEVDEIVSYYNTHPRPFHPDSEYLGVTLLGEAIKKNQVEIVDVLLEMGANPDKPTASVPRGAQNHIFFTTPLNPDFFELLLKAGANPNVVDKAGKPYLQYLVAAEYPMVPEIVEMFLASGATLTKQVVYDAVAYGLPKTIGVFMNAIAERKIPLTEFPKLVNSAIKRGDSKILEQLVEDGMSLVGTPDKPSLLEAIEQNNVLIAQYILEQGAAEEDPRFMKAAIVIGNRELVNLLYDAGMTASEDDVITAIRNKKSDIIDFFFEKGTKITPRIFYEIAASGDMNRVESLLARPEIKAFLRMKSSFLGNKTFFELAQTRGFSTEIANLILYGRRSNMWKGFSSSDMDKFDNVFETTAPEGERPPAQNWSLCPVCHKYSERETGCMYMHHNCSQSGDYYHVDLYNRFKDAQGKIWWCTICGRICNGETHYKISDWNKSHTSWPVGGNPFANDCRLTQHGGGLPEKMARFRTLRSVGLELQAQIDRMPERDARDRLVQAIWNPSGSSSSNVNAINLVEESASRWRIPASAFPTTASMVAAGAVGNPTYLESFANVNVRRPVADRNTLKPVLSGTKGYNELILEDGVDLITFKHRQPDGTIHEHTNISAAGLTEVLTSLSKTDDDFGRCFDATCRSNKVLLYPEEVKDFVEPDVFAKYRRDFNIKFARLPVNYEAPATNTAVAAGAAAGVAAGAAQAIGGAGIYGGGGRRRRTQSGGGANDYFNPIEDGMCLQRQSTNKVNKKSRRASAARKARRTRKARRI